MRTANWPRDEQEFESLFLAHHGGVYRLAYRIVGSQSEAEDVAQETFLKLHEQCMRGQDHDQDQDPHQDQDQHQPQEQDPGSENSLRPWLYRVAFHLALNARRGQGRRERRHRHAASREAAIGDPAADPGEALVRRDECESVRRVLESLPPRRSQILFLRYAGLSYQEVAEVMGVAAGSVGALLARAEAAFRAAYRQPEREGRGARRPSAEPHEPHEPHEMVDELSAHDSTRRERWGENA